MVKSTVLAAALMLPALAASAQQQPEVSITPNPAVPIERIADISLTFTADVTVANNAIYDNMSSPITFTQDATGTVVTKAFYFVPPNPAMADKKVVDLTLGQTIYSQSFLDKAGIEPGEASLYTAYPNGEYTLLIPAGTFMVGDVLNSELKFTYTLGDLNTTDVQITISPETFIGDAVSEATLTFSGNPAKIELNPACTSNIGLTSKYGMPLAVANFTPTIEGNTVKLALETPYTTPGTYYIDVPAGYFLIDGLESLHTTSGNYVINELEIIQEIMANPLVGAKLTAMEKASITWRGYKGVDFDSSNFDYDTTNLYFELGEDRYKAIATIDAAETDPYNATWTFTPRDIIKGDGKIRLVLPADQITIGGAHPASEVSFVWNLVDPTEYKIVLDPAPGKVTELSTITVTVEPEPTSFTFGDGEPFGVDLFIYDAGSDLYGILTNYSAEQIGLNTYKLIPGDPATAVGKYRLAFPSGYFKINGKPTEAMQFDYEIGNNSVESIFSADTLFTVSTIDGKAILRDADKAALAGLEKGNVYIINGKKVLVK